MITRQPSHDKFRRTQEGNIVRIRSGDDYQYVSTEEQFIDWLSRLGNNPLAAFYFEKKKRRDG